MVTRPELYVFAVNYRRLAHTHTHTADWVQNRAEICCWDRETGRDSCCCCCWYSCRRVRLYLLPSQRASVSIYCCVCVCVCVHRTIVFHCESLTLHPHFTSPIYQQHTHAHAPPAAEKKTVTSSHVWKPNLAFCVISINVTWWSYINVRSKAGS